MQLKAPVTLVSSTSRHASSLSRQSAPSLAMPALLIRKCTPPSRCLVSRTKCSTASRSRTSHRHGEDADAHGGERGLGEQRLLAHVPAGHVHEAEGDVAAELAELDGDVPAEAGGAAGDDRHLAAPAGAGRLRLRLLEQRRRSPSGAWYSHEGR